MTKTVIAAAVLLALACGGQQGLAAQQCPKTVTSATPAPTAVSPITLTGTGSKVTDPVDVPAGLWRAAWHAEGHRNFVVTVHGQGDNLLVNVILPDTPAGEAALSSDGGRFVFEVEADGATWTITLTRVAS